MNAANQTLMPATFGERLRALRKARSISLGAMADKLGITASHLSDVELGRRPPFTPSGGPQFGKCIEVLGLRGDDFADFYALSSAAKICVMVFFPTGDSGIHSGRSRFYVACTTCRVVVHENTTGLSIRINEHLREQSAQAGYARAMTPEDDERIADAQKRGVTL